MDSDETKTNKEVINELSVQNLILKNELLLDEKRKVDFKNMWMDPLMWCVEFFIRLSIFLLSWLILLITFWIVIKAFLFMLGGIQDQYLAGNILDVIGWTVMLVGAGSYLFGLHRDSFYLQLGGIILIFGTLFSMR